MQCYSSWSCWVGVWLIGFDAIIPNQTAALEQSQGRSLRPTNRSAGTNRSYDCLPIHFQQRSLYMCTFVYVLYIHRSLVWLARPTPLKNYPSSRRPSIRLDRVICVWIIIQAFCNHQFYSCLIHAPVMPIHRTHCSLPCHRIVRGNVCTPNFQRKD